MSPSATPTPSPPLHPAALAGMQADTVNALPPRPGASDAEKTAQREGALAFLAALRPGDPVQAMLAVHIIASHYAAMECFRIAARGDLSSDLHLRTVGKAVALCRMIERAMRELARLQGVPALRPAAPRPASVPAARVQPAAEPAHAETPSQPALPESRHERRRRERAERHLAAAGRRAGHAAGVAGNAIRERLMAEVAALAGAARAAVPA
jgi:hypothetical protein